MKKFDREENKTVVYIHIKDVITLIQLGYNLEEVKNEENLLDENSYDDTTGIIRFTNEKMIKLLKDATFIIDYEVYKKKESSEIKEEIASNQTIQLELIKDYHDKSKTREERIQALKEYNFIEYKNNELMNLIQLRARKKLNTTEKNKKQYTKNRPINIWSIFLKHKR